MGWHFIPMDGYRSIGIVVSPDMKPVSAEFLTPHDARVIAQQQREARMREARTNVPEAMKFGFDPASLKASAR